MFNNHETPMTRSFKQLNARRMKEKQRAKFWNTMGEMLLNAMALSGGIVFAVIASDYIYRAVA